ncbi:substrate-binding periplasmic protein [Aestuariibacter salexigens]|uniref:substrate-binding periplasmic protein n=1 Tax=Aestuariibacter salexigens TaxID=226010 RepID=UPI0003FEC9C2|nr:transporter substrate-binding domain-containing protein [Aestuariibacter salexigens]
MRLFKLLLTRGFFITCWAFITSSHAKNELNLASIEYLAEQQVGMIVLAEIYKKMDVKVAITPMPGKRAEKELMAQRADGEAMRIYTYGEDVPTSLRIEPPYYYLQTMAFVKNDRDINIPDADSLDGLRIAIVRGVKHTENITEGLSNVYPVSSTEAMFRLLERDMVDVALTNDTDGRWHLQKIGLDDTIRATGKPLATLPVYHYLDKKHQTLANRVGDVISNMQASGELDIVIAGAERRVITQMLSLTKD